MLSVQKLKIKPKFSVFGHFKEFFKFLYYDPKCHAYLTTINSLKCLPGKQATCTCTSTYTYRKLVHRLKFRLHFKNYIFMYSVSYVTMLKYIIINLLRKIPSHQSCLRLKTGWMETNRQILFQEQTRKHCTSISNDHPLNRAITDTKNKYKWNQAADLVHLSRLMKK